MKKKRPLAFKSAFLSGVDALSQNALYYLEKIMRFGSKNGVLSFVNLESEKNNKSTEDLKRYAECFKDRTSFERLKYLNIEVINDHGIQSKHMKDFADKIKAYYEKKKAVKRELKDLQKTKNFGLKALSLKCLCRWGGILTIRKCVLKSVTNKTTRSFAGAAGGGNPISCMC